VATPKELGSKKSTESPPTLAELGIDKKNSPADTITSTHKIATKLLPVKEAAGSWYAWWLIVTGLAAGGNRQY